MRDRPRRRSLILSFEPFRDGWEGDGRVFRDCTWNYNTILELVKRSDPQLVEDALKAWGWWPHKR